MQSEKLRQLIDEYLNVARMMQVATSTKDQPWVCTVYFATDTEWSLYWLSKGSRRHSEEIDQNSRVAGAIVLPHTPGDAVRGLQFQGHAEIIQEPETLRREFTHYGNRFNCQSRVEEIISGRDAHRLYRIVPSLFVLFDEVNYPSDPRQEFTPGSTLSGSAQGWG